MPTPPCLSELQRAFGAALVDNDDARLAPWIAARGIDPAARLRIYRHAHLAIHVEALMTSFPAVVRLLGEDCFDGLATRHAARVGSTSGNLQAYGADFPGFLAVQPELAGVAWVAEVARLEWLRQEAALAAPNIDVDPVTLALALAHAADPFVDLQPHLRVCDATVPALDLWCFAMGRAPAPATDAGPQHVLLWRAGEAVAMHAVAPTLACFVRALQDGHRLAAAWAIARTPSLAPEAVLAPLLQHRLIAAITSPSEDTGP